MLLPRAVGINIPSHMEDFAQIFGLLAVARLAGDLGCAGDCGKFSGLTSVPRSIQEHSPAHPDFCSLAGHQQEIQAERDRKLDAAKNSGRIAGGRRDG